MDNKKTLTVKGIDRKEDSKGDRKATIVMKGAGKRGESTLKLVIEDEDAQDFQMGEFYEISWRQVEAPKVCGASGSPTRSFRANGYSFAS